MHQTCTSINLHLCSCTKKLLNADIHNIHCVHCVPCMYVYAMLQPPGFSPLLACFGAAPSFHLPSVCMTPSCLTVLFFFSSHQIFILPGGGLRGERPWGRREGGLMARHQRADMLRVGGTSPPLPCCMASQNPPQVLNLPLLVCMGFLTQ